MRSRTALIALLCAVLLGCSRAQDDDEMTAPAPSPEPTQAPTTPAPTKTPTPAPTKRDKSWVISADESFLDFFVDRFNADFDYNEDQGNTEVPPTFIYDNGSLNSQWRMGVTVPKHLNYFIANIWHGNHRNVTSYFDEDLKAKVTIANKNIVSRVKVSLEQKLTTQFNFEMECIADGVTELLVSIDREKSGKRMFKLIKECSVSHSDGLLISLHSGELVFHDGHVLPEFDVHDRRGISFIASKEDQSDVFYFHTYLERGGFEIVGNPSVHAHKPTEALLQWIASTQPGLQSMAEKYKQKLAMGLIEAGSDDDTNDEEDDYEEEYEEEDKANEEEIIGSETTEADMEKVPDSISGGVLKEITNTGDVDADETGYGSICKPAISGILAEGKRTRIVYHEELGEKKLLGFASAGLLGMHGGRKLQIDYNCLRDGLAVISLSFYVRRLGDKKDVSDRIDFNWLKVCSAEQFSSDSELDLMGFNVHLGMYAREEPSFFPILNGLTTESFRWNTISMIASPEEVSTSFYINLRESIEEDRKKNGITEAVRVRKVSVSAEKGRKVSNTKLSGHGAAGGIVSSDSMPVTVHYNCKKTGTIRMTLKLKLDIVRENSDGSIENLSNRMRTLRFHWIKYCAVTPLDQLLGSTEDPARFTLPTTDSSVSFSDSRAFNSIPTISNGKVSSLFVASEANSRNVMASLYHVNSNDKTFAIKLYAKPVDQSNSRAHMGILFNEPVLTTSNTHCQAVLRDIGEMESMYNLGIANFMEENLDATEIASLPQKRSKSSMQSLYEVTKEAPMFLVVDHICHNSGDSMVTLQLPIYGRTDEILTFRWVKQCSYSEIKLDAKQTGGTVAFFVTLAVIITSAIFCVVLRRQRQKILYLRSKDKHGFDRMDVVSSL